MLSIRNTDGNDVCVDCGAPSKLVVLWHFCYAFTLFCLISKNSLSAFNKRCKLWKLGWSSPLWLCLPYLAYTSITTILIGNWNIFQKINLKETLTKIQSATHKAQLMKSDYLIIFYSKPMLTLITEWAQFSSSVEFLLLANDAQCKIFLRLFNSLPRRWP